MAARKFVLDLLHIQLLAGLSLAGMALGWRGGMRELHGFYDSQKAVTALMFGIGIGSIAAAATDILVFEPYYALVIQGSSSLSWATMAVAAFVSAGLSAITLRFAASRRARATFAAPAIGWAFGLGTGAMLAMRMGYRVLELADGVTIPSLIRVGALVLLLPLIHAIIGCGLGSRAQRGSPFLALFWATFWHLVAVNLITYAVLVPIGWILILPPFLIGMRRANTVWMRHSLHPEAARRLRRVRAEAKRKLLQEQVLNGTPVIESE
ncbi:MAG TPA: hypothetical protein EYG04_00325 [Candidatus Poseidoniales archaeon]|nr:hypothetical protein [Candidatus Poseidoniales archaeon]